MRRIILTKECHACQHSNVVYCHLFSVSRRLRVGLCWIGWSRGHLLGTSCPLGFPVVSARARSAEYTTGICFETAKNTKPSNDSSLDFSIPFENLIQLKTFIL